MQGAGGCKFTGQFIRPIGSGDEHQSWPICLILNFLS